MIAKLGRKLLLAIGSLLVVAGIVIVGVCLAFIFADDAVIADYDELQEEVVEIVDDVPTVDFEVLEEVEPDAQSWLTIPGFGINYPVYQGDDNEYYLYHSPTGRLSYTSIFLDHRCTSESQNSIIYGHTLLNGSMFSPLSKMYRQSNFDDLSSVWYSTPETGSLPYTPIAAFTVSPNEASIQQFEFDDAANVDDLKAARLAEHAANKDITGTYIEGDDSIRIPEGMSIVVSSTDYIIDGKPVRVNDYYTLTDDEVAEIDNAAFGTGFHGWLREICGKATAKSPFYESLISSASRSLMLICCSPMDSQRTVLLCVN